MNDNERTLDNKSVRYDSLEINGLNIAYREAGEESSPKLVLLHGFPSSSHQYRDLIRELADKFHVIVPDYPGFGLSDIPDPTEYEYTFDAISDAIEELLEKKGFERYGLYVQDYGGPVGFRIVGRNPRALEWLIVQNSNAYEIGFTEAWDGLRNSLWKNRSRETEQPLEAFMALDTIKAIYLHGAARPELISPDNWLSDFAFIQRPNVIRLNLDLFYDYRKNVDIYPAWQAFLRDNKPKTIIFWGQMDIFFTPEGGEAYLADLPDAEIHRLDAGHFAVEDHLEFISENINRFYDQNVSYVSAIAGK